MKKLDDFTQKFLGSAYESLDARTQKVARHITGRTHIARGPEIDPQAPPTRGQRAADAVAAFGGSWTSIGIFAAVPVVWVLLNHCGSHSPPLGA